MGPEDGSASPMHRRCIRRCGSMWSPICFMSTSPMHRPRRRGLAGASPMHCRCIGDAARSSDPIYSDPI
eukprot:6663222-Pyramimonas_sp.AAC.1